MDYKELLEHSYKVTLESYECGPGSRLEYLSEHIFGFITYDSEMAVLFARKAVEVCAAINNRLTFDYILKSKNDYCWFLLMCNMPFFAERIEWGCSIRDAWWGSKSGKPIEFQSCGLWVGDEQLHETIKFSDEDWKIFIAALMGFAEEEMKPNRKI